MFLQYAFGPNAFEKAKKKHVENIYNIALVNCP